MHASASIVIERSIRDVFRGISDIHRLDQWMEGISNPQFLSDGALDLGTTFTTDSTYGRRTAPVVYQVTVFDPPHRFAVKAVEGPFPLKGHLECIGLGGRTQVHYIVDAGADGAFTKLLFTLGGPLVRVLMQRRLQCDLERLRHLMGSTAPAETPAYAFGEARLAA